MEEDHEKLEETMRSEHEVSIASYVAETELLTEVILCHSYYFIGRQSVVEMCVVFLI